MIRTGRLNSFSLGIICVRERTMGNNTDLRKFLDTGVPLIGGGKAG